MKKLFYLTLDETNAMTATNLAAQHGVPLEVAEPRDLPYLKQERAHVLLDWDFIPEDLRLALLCDVTINLDAIHGYNLSDELASSLPQRNIVCSIQLDDTLFRMLIEQRETARTWTARSPSA